MLKNIYSNMKIKSSNLGSKIKNLKNLNLGSSLKNLNVSLNFKNLNSVLNYTKLKNINTYMNINKLLNYSFNKNYISISVLKYDPFLNNTPWVQTWILSRHNISPMMLDSLFALKDKIDESLSFRRSCREGICGSCAMNVNGINTLVCTKNIKKENKKKYHVFPLPHMPIIKDLVVNMDHFYYQYKSIDPFLKTKSLLSTNMHNIFGKYLTSIDIETYDFKSENIQSKSDRLLLDGLYECILCASCSTSCPSYWWNQDKYLGPAVLLQSFRWIIDSRDDEIIKRLENLNDDYKLYRCHTILNCVQTCPKKLSPAKAISNIKTLIKLSSLESN